MGNKHTQKKRKKFYFRGPREFEPRRVSRPPTRSPPLVSGRPPGISNLQRSRRRPGGGGVVDTTPNATRDRTFLPPSETSFLLSDRNTLDSRSVRYRESVPSGFSRNRRPDGTRNVCCRETQELGRVTSRVRVTATLIY